MNRLTLTVIFSEIFLIDSILWFMCLAISVAHSLPLTDWCHLVAVCSALFVDFCRSFLWWTRFFLTARFRNNEQKKSLHRNRKQIASCITLRTWCIVKHRIIFFLLSLFSIDVFNANKRDILLVFCTFLLVFCFGFMRCRLWSTREPMHTKVWVRASSCAWSPYETKIKKRARTKKSEYKKCVKSSNHNPLVVINYICCISLTQRTSSNHKT